MKPMKTVAAVALSSPGYLSLPEVMAAGLGVGCVMLLLGLTGAMDLINRAVPGSIVRGIQLAVGLQLAQKVSFWVGAFLGGNTSMHMSTWPGTQRVVAAQVVKLLSDVSPFTHIVV